MSNIVESKKFVCAACGEGENHNKIWEYEIYDNGTALVKWGRVGKGMQSKTFPASYPASKINEKLAKGYEEVKTLETTGVAVNSKGSPTGDIKSIVRKQIKSKHALTQKLIDRLITVNAHNVFEASGGRIKYNNDNGLFTLPIGGVVTKESIDQARDILVDLSDYVKNKKYNTRGMEESVNKYLKLIPQEVGRKLTTETFLPDFSAIQRQNDLLDSLDASYASIVSGQKKTSDSKDEDSAEISEPKLFDVKLDLNENAQVFARIQKLYKDTRKDQHVCANLKVVRVYDVEIAAMKEAFEKYGKKINNIMELWHGTKIANLLSILKSGFIIPPASAAQCTGRLFGNGVYFSNQSTKSLNYAYGYWGGGRRESNCFMFLNSVSLGNYYVPQYQEYKLPKGYDSFWAKPGRSGIQNDEMIVFSTSQVNPIYLIEFDE